MSTVVVHLPSGPVAGRILDPRRVDVAGVALPVVVEGHRADRRLAVLPTRRDAHGGTDTFYALVEPYVPGALDIQGERGVQRRGEGREGQDGQQHEQQQNSRHARKVAPSDAKSQSGGRR